MRKIYWIVGVVVVISLVYSFSSTDKKKVSKDYVTRIMEARQAKDEYFESGKDSPIKDKKAFHGLHYYIPDVGYRVRATLEASPKPEMLEMPTSSGKNESYIKYGYVAFNLLGKKHRLLVLKKEPKDKILFIAFTDQTTGEETYGAGRYLDVPLVNGNEANVILDFNQAYNPYCAYNESYVCPMPPQENHMEVAVRAGEKAEKH
ncbi:DUF1684 domain-containing protein [uncultured Microscilla sp.]|uniref:DUF1684 domain-containing protein n=1 Tax=uncultured Microscilla sp. TaxID=432653 RepID=UPI002610C520|nr:DUF1684 domain-containing protein [uncultured Microscilla sp.]